MRRVGAALWLTVVWIVLWESYDLLAVVGGLTVATVLVVALPREASGFDAFRPLPVLRFLGRYAWQVIEANAIVAWEVITPGEGINEGIIAIPVPGASDPVVLALSNAISLTPGTLLVEIDRDPTVLYVHVLHLRDLDQARLDIFKMERALTLAFGTEASLQDVDRRIAALRREHPELDPPTSRPTS